MIVRHVGERRRVVLGHGTEYVVLALKATRSAHDPLMLMIYFPNGSAFDWSWEPIDGFEVVSNALPKNWVYDQNEYGFSLMPDAWRRPGHWDDLDRDEYDDRLTRAWDDYRRARDAILAEAGQESGHQGLPGPSCPLPHP